MNIEKTTLAGQDDAVIAVEYVAKSVPSVPSLWETYTKRSQDRQKEIWVEIGNKNPWIANACNPPFDTTSIVIYTSALSLADRLLQGNWCLGQGFAWKDQCWINQVNGGDEWLVIKKGTPFESVTAAGVERSRAGGLLELIRVYDRASVENCLALNFVHP